MAYNQAPPPRGYKTINPPRAYTPIGETYDRAPQTLLANDHITLSEARPYEPQVKPSWWNEKHLYAYH